MSSVDINSSNIPLGSHTLDIYATDRTGNTSQKSLTLFKPFYTVQGNRLIDKSTNNEVILYGTYISRPDIFDPNKSLAFNNWRDVSIYINKDLDEIKNNLKANAIRLGINPAWMQNFSSLDEYYRRLDYYIQTTIYQAIQRDLIILLDFHAVDSSVYPYTKGSTTYGKRYSDTKTTYELMIEFWQRYVPIYSQGIYGKYVFFELWNEEVRNAEVLNEWLDYRDKMEYVINNIIRPQSANVIVVNGLNNGLNLRRVVEGYPIRDPINLLVYGWHAYPNSVRPTYEEREALTDYFARASINWNWNLRGTSSTFVTSIYPTMITEFGWRDPNIRTDLTESQKNEYGGRYVRSNNTYDYGKSILTYANNNNIKGHFPFRFYYEKLAIVDQMPNWWNPNRTYNYTPDYGEIIKNWYNSRRIP
jgi:hypothetical protein